MKMKKIFFFVLLVCMFYSNVGAMQKGCNPFEDPSISELLYQMVPAFPTSCLKCVRYLVRTNRLHDARVLNHIENVIINLLIRFDGQNINLNPENGRDLVCAWAAFKILTSVRREVPHFYDVQHMQVCNFLTTHGIITEQEIEQGYWNPCEAGALFEAALNENLRALVRAIVAGADVHATVNNPGDLSHGMTALHLAAYYGHTDVIQVLVDIGADVNATVNNPEHYFHGMTTLHLAAWKGASDVIQALVAAGTNVNATVNIPGWFHGYTALHLAADIHADAIQALVAAVLPKQKLAFVNAIIDNPGHCNHGKTALDLVAEEGPADAVPVQTLIDAGTQVPENLLQSLQKFGIHNVPENQIVH